MLKTVIQDSIQRKAQASFRAESETWLDAVYEFLSKRVPFSTDRPIFTYIYISCLSSLINAITPPNSSHDKPENVKLFYGQVEERIPYCIVLYNISYNMTNYIAVLTREIWDIIVNEKEQVTRPKHG